jgi:hypothetical protein
LSCALLVQHLPRVQLDAVSPTFHSPWLPPPPPLRNPTSKARSTHPELLAPPRPSLRALCSM